MSAVFSTTSTDRETVACGIFKVDQAAFTQAAKAFIQIVGKMKSKEAQEAAEMANEYLTLGDKYLAISRRVPHGLAGLMILSRQEGSLKIEAVCAHPMSKTVGLQLVQRAVNESVKAGLAGRLVLTDRSNGNALYRNTGFTPLTKDEGEIKMKLDPSLSKNWAIGKGGRYVAQR